MDTKIFLENFGTIAESPGGIDRIRSLIIDVALQGGLSEQLGLEHVDESLLVLALEGINLPRVPGNWRWLSLESTGRLFVGTSANASDKSRLAANVVGVPYVATKDVGYGRAEINYANGLTVAEGDQKFKRAQAGSVLLCLEGGSAGRKMGICEQEVTFGNKLLANEPHRSIEPKYLLAVYQSSFFQRQFKERLTGIIGGVSQKALRKIPVPVPPWAEQRRIVAKVDELMALCDELEEKQSHKTTITTKLRGSAFNALRQAETPDDIAAAWERISTNWSHLTNHPDSIPELRQTILDLAFTGKMMLDTPKGASGEWNATTLGEVAEIGTGKLDANASSPNGQYPFFTCARLPLRIETFTYDFECALIGGNGNFDVHYANGKFDAYQRTYIIKPHAVEETSAKFLYWFLQGYSDELRKQSIGGVIQYLKIGFLKDAPLHLPSLPIQEILVSKIEFMLSMCDELESQLQDQQDLSSRLTIASTRLTT